MTRGGEIRVGTSGWSYPSGDGTWNGIFYPKKKSKKEAIALMLENPNLIRRPIVIKGSKVIFGFDKERYEKL